MTRPLLLLLMLCTLASPLAAQRAGGDSEDFHFTLYLVGQGLKDDAVTLARHWRPASDSAHFARGYAFYSARLLDSAAVSFARVGEGSVLRAEALFYAALSQAHLGRPDSAAATLVRIAAAQPDVLNLKRFEQAGVSLLQRDLPAFDRAFGLTDTTDFRLAAEARSLLSTRDAIAAHRPKSPLLAGMLSAIVPGLGKVYAGSYGEGAAAFLLTGSLAAVTAENWVRQGPLNWKTLLSGLLTAVFYAGNVYGSAVSVKVANDDFNHLQDVQILYDIHIPIRNSHRR